MPQEVIHKEEGRAKPNEAKEPGPSCALFTELPFLCSWHIGFW
jgi:hypothetical protein